jgi:urea carboxylase-associated protein 2
VARSFDTPSNVPDEEARQPLDTATPRAARDHARAQAGTSARTQRTVPATAAADLPDGVDGASVVWDETLPPGGYASRVLARGTRLRVTDLDGGACVQVLAYNAANPVERLNVADTVKVQWNAYLGEGDLLLSDMGRVLLAMVEDTGGRHDALCGWSTPASNAAAFGDGSMHGPHPSGRDRFLQALARHGLSRADLMPSLNLFRTVVVADDGSLTLDPAADAGAHVTLRAEMDVLVVLVHAPHVLDPGPGYPTGLVRCTAWSGRPTPHDDPVRTATPEGERAYENVDDWLAR